MSRGTSNFIVGLLAGVVVAGGIFAWIGQRTDSGGGSGAKVLKVAHCLPTNHPVHKGLEEFKRVVEERSGGRLRIEIFPSGQLGSETESLEKVQAGTLDITKTSAAPIGNFVPAFKVFSLPYLFRDEEHYWKVLEGPAGRKMLDLLDEGGGGAKSSGLHGLGYFDSGSRSFYAVKPVRSPADLKGLKIRVMNDQVAMDMVEALGASPTPIAYGELYTALKQGTVDGAENNPPSFVTSHHCEICKNYILDRHARIPDVIMISSKVWKHLDAREREWISEGIAEATRFQRKLWKETVEKDLEDLRARGVTILEPDEAGLEAFRAATKPVIGKYRRDPVLGPLVDEIRRAGLEKTEPENPERGE